MRGVTRIVSVRAKELLIVASLVSGCSGLLGSTPKTVGAGDVPLQATAGVDPDVTPFVLEVLEEYNDGSHITVKGRLLPKSTWSADEVVVRLAAFDRNGEEKISFHRVSEILGDGKGAPEKVTLEKGIARTFTLTVPERGVSSYHLEVLWGRDALALLPTKPAPSTETKESKQFIALRNMEVHRVPSESCVTPDECVVIFTVTGEIFNSGAGVVKDVVIAAGFENATKGLALDNERIVEVPNLRLPPGAGKRFKISLEKLVASSTLVAPIPTVRIASFTSE